MVLATISKTEGFRYWICALLMISCHEEIAHILNVLVDALRQVGLVLNVGRTKKNNDAHQHPAELVSPGRIVVQILERERAHKWLGCMISAYTDGSRELFWNTTSKLHPEFLRKSILCAKNLSTAQRLAHFDAMVTPVACFASGHRKIYQQDLPYGFARFNM